jgi:hypothetical protein
MSEHELVIRYPTYLSSIHKLVDRICRQINSEILIQLLDKEGYQLITTIDRKYYEQVASKLFRYSSLFSLN